jgi:hypothetical protein
MDPTSSTTKATKTTKAEIHHPQLSSTKQFQHQLKHRLFPQTTLHRSEKAQENRPQTRTCMEGASSPFPGRFPTTKSSSQKSTSSSTNKEKATKIVHALKSA